MDYLDPVRGNFTEAWYQNQDDVVRAHFDATLFALRGTRDWTKSKSFKVLSQKHAGLAELIIDIVVQADKRQFKRHIRPVGIWYPQEYVFVLLLGSEKSGRIYTPPNAFDTALDLKAQFELGKGTLDERI